MFPGTGRSRWSGRPGLLCQCANARVRRRTTAGTRDIWHSPGRDRKVVPAGREEFAFPRGGASASGAKGGKVLVRVVGATGQRSCRNQPETFGAGQGGIFGEFVG